MSHMIDLVKGQNYDSRNFGLVTYNGIDIFHGEQTHKFTTSQGPRYIKSGELKFFLQEKNPYKTELIKQRTEHDCAIACMAMLIGKSWEDTNSVIGHLVDYDGDRPGMRDEQEALRLLGFSGEFQNGEPVGDFVCKVRGYYISAEFFRSIAWGRRALMSVPSLNFTGQWHMVYWNGMQVFDPSTLKTYTKFTELLPNEMIVFNEILVK